MEKSICPNCSAPFDPNKEILKCIYCGTKFKKKLVKVLDKKFLSNEDYLIEYKKCSRELENWKFESAEKKFRKLYKLLNKADDRYRELIDINKISSNDRSFITNNLRDANSLDSYWLSYWCRLISEYYIYGDLLYDDYYLKNEVTHQEKIDWQELFVDDIYEIDLENLDTMYKGMVERAKDILNGGDNPHRRLRFIHHFFDNICEHVEPIILNASGYISLYGSVKNKGLNRKLLNQNNNSKCLFYKYVLRIISLFKKDYEEYGLSRNLRIVGGYGSHVNLEKIDDFDMYEHQRCFEIIHFYRRAKEECYREVIVDNSSVGLFRSTKYSPSLDNEFIWELEKELKNFENNFDHFIKNINQLEEDYLEAAEIDNTALEKNKRISYYFEPIKEENIHKI